MSSVFQLPQPTGQGTTLRGGSVVHGADDKDGA